MTLKKLFRMKLAFIAFALFLSTSVLTEVANATYPPLPTHGYGCMTCQTLRILDGAVQKYSNTVTYCAQRDRTADPVQSNAIELESGKTYTIQTNANCYQGTSCSYGGKVGCWIDFNGNHSYADAGERVWWYYWGTGYNSNLTTTFTVPSLAEGKVFRMILVNCYYYYVTDYGYSNQDPVYTGTMNPGYGDRACLDFYVPKKAEPDAGALSIVQPSGAITQGTQNIAVRITNYDDMAPLESCRIVWRIDEGLGTESSNTYSWTGNLNQGQTADVVVGTYPFNELREYSIDAFTEFPNGENDWVPGNDRCITKYVAPALSPGIYYIGAYGGSSSTFATITEGTDYLSAAGIIGDGVLEFVFPTANPGPAVYDGPIIIGTYPSTGDNSVGIRSMSDDPADVVIQYTPTVLQPYLMSMIDVNNTTIKGFTFNTSSGVTNAGIIDLANCNNVTVENNIFENKVGSARNNNFTSLNLSNCYDITVQNNEFRNGAIGINESGTCPRKLDISYNTFSDNSWKSIQLYGTPNGMPCTENSVKVDTNKFTGTNTQFGISSTNGTEITRNQFNGFAGTSTSDAVIYVTNTDPANFTGQTLIEKSVMTAAISNIHGIYAVNIPDLRIQNNKITVTDGGGVATNCVTINGSGTTSPVYLVRNQITNGASGIPTAAVNNNGVSLSNSIVRASYNDIDVVSAGAAVYGFTATNTGGYIANSQLGAISAYSMYMNNSSMGVYYNSIANQSTTVPALLIQGGTGTIRRNLVQNEGLGPAIVANSALGNTIDENNYWTKDLSAPIELGRWSGVAAADLAEWQAASGKDANSSSIEIDFVDFSQFNLGLNTFDEVLVFDDPIDFGDPMLNDEIQQTDYLGQIRYSYFMGSENIVPEVFITNQPVGIMDCVGSTGHFFGTTAFVTRGVQARYEWFKDGKSLTEYYVNPTDDWAEKASIYLDSLPFAGTEPGLNYDMEGTYSCFVRGSGAEPKWTESILVNALSDAEVTREPEDARVDVGGIAILEVEAHIVADEGIDDPLYQPEVQWFFNNANRDSVINDLSVDGHFTGAGSTILTVRNIDQELLDGPLQDGVFAVLKGACNTLTSAPAFVKLFPQVFINEDPADASVCNGTDHTFEITASTDPDATLEYQWRKDGITIDGATMDELTITGVDATDAGVYDCVVTVVPGGKSKTSLPATLSVLDAVAITTQPVDQTVAEGNPFTLFVTATGEAPLTYQWLKDDVEITGATEATYSVTSASISIDGGIYICNVTNICGTVATNPVTVTVTPGGIVDVTDITNGGFALSNNTPNPFADNSKIRFLVPQTTYVRLAITDVYGQEVAVLVDKTVSFGWHDININASSLKLSSGVYYYTLTSNNYSLTNKMVVVR
ncbi:MAG: immunoglobulin domain-containing protein [bacterium]